MDRAAVTFVAIIALLGLLPGDVVRAVAFVVSAWIAPARNRQCAFTMSFCVAAVIATGALWLGQEGFAVTFGFLATHNFGETQAGMRLLASTERLQQRRARAVTPPARF